MKGFGCFLLLAAVYSACRGDAGAAAACFFIGLGLFGAAGQPAPRKIPPRKAVPVRVQPPVETAEVPPLFPDLRQLYYSTYLDPPPGIHYPY